jgi:hypothetical protein
MREYIKQQREVLMFKSQGAAVYAAFETVTGSKFNGCVKLDVDTRKKIGDELKRTYEAGLWTIKSERCNSGEGLLKYIGGDEKSSMKCNIIDNFLSRDKKAEKEKKVASVATPTNDKVSLIKAALDAGLITQEVATQKMMELLAA